MKMWILYFVVCPDKDSDVSSLQSYWEGELLPALKRFYFDLYVPAYVEKEMRRMAGDDFTPPKPM